jgi:hypothetical protein
LTGWVAGAARRGCARRQMRAMVRRRVGMGLLLLCASKSPG